MFWGLVSLIIKRNLKQIISRSPPALNTTFLRLESFSQIRYVFVEARPI